MESHTIPRKLLDQFAYDDHVTGSRRLWQYARGRAPWRRASPRTATRVSNHFADPGNAQREARLEERLNHEFEDPVHKFIYQLRFRTFGLSRHHIRHLTPYVTLLWNRSVARRVATKEQVDVGIESCRSLLANDEQISRIAAKCTLDIIGDGHLLRRIVTPAEVREAVQQMINTMSTQDHVQTTYVDAMERAMAYFDDSLDNGQWNLMYTTPELPFVLGDAPVVTWERNDNNALIFGMGFARPNVEAILPVAPTACLHILPAVERTRRIAVPTPREVNQAQASFATSFCYTNQVSPELNAILQPHFSRSRIGVNAFSIRHRNYANTMFEILMNRGEGFNAPTF